MFFSQKSLQLTRKTFSTKTPNTPKHHTILQQTNKRFFSASTPSILVTGALGQIGQELIPVRREKYGADRVFASDIRRPDSDSEKLIYLDVLKYEDLSRVCVENKINIIIHNTALLSAVGEQNPQTAIQVNCRGLENVLEVARVHKVKVFAPSSIAAFGPSTPHDVPTPDLTIMRPTTIYGISKVYLELLGEYYHMRYGVDFRSLRYPGIISAKNFARRRDNRLCHSHLSLCSEGGKVFLFSQGQHQAAYDVYA
eukprot:TRINITY_DN1346_c0_g1_i2.p1 TRINITY_DN1346_c0_g1~~TRINITY_DN1346_c0_g1_i2.p1  ORF type:complete len:254 (-),score=39.76 TRINITY_DN1346_c0_g1_i2:498-1259(-)